MESVNGEPYRLWSADAFRCPGGCGTEIVLIRPTQEPMAMAHEPDFDRKLAQAKEFSRFIEVGS